MRLVTGLDTPDVLLEFGCAGIFHNGLAELGLVEFSVDAFLGEELLVRAALGDGSVLNYQDFICRKDGRKPVRDKNTCLTLNDRIDSILDLLLRDRIERRCGLVENEYRRIFKYYPRDGDSLLLTA